MSRCKACDEVLSGSGDDELCYKCLSASRGGWLPEDIYDINQISLEDEDMFEEVGEGCYRKKPLPVEY